MSSPRRRFDRRSHGMNNTARRLAYLVAAALITSGCATSQGATHSPSVGSTPSPATPSSGAADTGATSTGLFDIGGGQRLYVKCEGEGSPTIILEAGDESDSGVWGPAFQDRLAEHTRTCAYDRRGLGQSDPASGCRELPDLVGDLERLLSAAAIEAPYVLVGTSGGGYIEVGFAVGHKPDIAGMVIIDTSQPYIDPPPDLVEETSCTRPGNVERRNFLQVEKQAWAMREEIGDIPVTIMSVEYTRSSEINEKQNVTGQQGWLVLSPRAEQLIVHTGHVVFQDDPDLVIREILNVLAAAKAA
jgi:serine aminopeptidase S33 family